MVYSYFVTKYPEEQHTMRPINKKQNKTYIVPILVFLFGCLILSMNLYNSYKANQEKVRTITELNATTYTDHLQNDMNRGIAITDALKGIVISENGEVKKFQKVSENLMTDYIQSIQIAPGGVVTDIYPEAENEAGKIDLINDEKKR